MREDVAGRLQHVLSTGTDLSTRSIFLYGEINEQTAFNFSVGLKVMDDYPGDIFVWLSTSGGHVVDGMAIYDAIKLARNPVTIVGTGTVMSMGTVIMQAADMRLLTESTRFMIHDGSAELSGDPKTIMSLSADLKYMHSRDLDILASRAKKSREEIEKMSTATTFFSAREALDAGLIDGIVTPQGIVSSYNAKGPVFARRKRGKRK